MARNSHLACEANAYEQHVGLSASVYRRPMRDCWNAYVVARQKHQLRRHLDRHIELLCTVVSFMTRLMKPSLR